MHILAGSSMVDRKLQISFFSADTGDQQNPLANALFENLTNAFLMREKMS